MFAIKQYGQQYDDVTQKKLREYKVWLIENYKPKTVNLRLRALNCYLESIGKEKLKLPFVRVQQKSYLENVISEADYEYFKSCLKKDDEMFWYFVIRFLAATGARVSELIQIKAEHVKLGHLDLYSKGGKLRRIYIPKELQNKALSWLAEKQQKSGFIFLNKYGERITTRGISGQLKKLAVRYNINPAVVYPHSFRHRLAKSFLERCNDIAFLADLMGHESIETTRIYLRKTATERPLESVYAVVFMDAIHFHARNEGRIVKRAVYIAIGIDMEGRKDVLGMYVGQNESAKFWLSILNGLKNRGVEDILIACVDGLTGFPQAIEAVFPQTEIQQCIIHQIRNTTKFVSYKEIKPLMADLKRVYAAPTEEVALAELDSFDEKWSGKYPKIAKSWKDNWANLSTYFKYPEAVRRLIYTTNTMEGFNRQLRKVTKSKTVFPSDDSLLKMLYLAMIDITKKWTGHRQDWGQIHSQLEIFFEERLERL